MKPSGLDRQGEFWDWQTHTKSIDIPEDPKNSEGSEEQEDNLLDFDAYMKKNGKKVEGQNPDNNVTLYSVEVGENGTKKAD